jgi:hypothetical protein
MGRGIVIRAVLPVDRKAVYQDSTRSWELLGVERRLHTYDPLPRHALRFG